MFLTLMLPGLYVCVFKQMSNKKNWPRMAKIFVVDV